MRNVSPVTAGESPPGIPSSSSVPRRKRGNHVPKSVVATALAASLAAGVE
jgi:hypothetical protein